MPQLNVPNLLTFVRDHPALAKGVLDAASAEANKSPTFIPDVVEVIEGQKPFTSLLEAHPELVQTVLQANPTLITDLIGTLAGKNSPALESLRGLFT